MTTIQEAAVAKELAGLISAPTAVNGAISADPGHVYVVMKNGRTHKVIKVGQRRRPGFGIPVFGEVEVVAVVCGRREALLQILNVSSADGFRMPKVDVRVTISLAGDDNYKEFKKAVDRDGYAFVGRVETVLRNAVERIVRQRLADTTHRALYGMAAADLFGDIRNERLADGLLVLHAIDEVVPDYDPKFVQVYDVARETAAVKAEGAVAMVREETNAEIMVARIRSLTPIAEALGQPVDWLLDPKLRRGAEQRAFELAKKAVDNPAIMRRFPELGATVRAIVQAGTPIAAPRVNAVTQSAYLEASGHTLELPKIMNIALPSPAAPRTSSAGPVPALHRDARLARAWEATGSDPEDLLGVAAATTAGRGSVVLVTATRPASAVFSQLRAAIAHVLEIGPDQLQQSCVVNPRDLDAVVCDYLMNRLFFVNNAVSIRLVTQTGEGGHDRLRILLSSEDGSARTLLKSINDPTGLVLEPLAALLPFAGIDAELDHAVAR